MAGEIEPFLMILYGFYNTVFHPILAMGPYISLGFFSFCLAGLFSIIYWYMLDIEKAEEVKEKISTYQDKMKEARSNDKTDKASEHMQKTMQLNQRLMKLNLKPMIGTMIFVGLLFPWLGTTFAPAVELTEVSENTFEGNLTYANQDVPLTVINESGNVTVETGNQTGEIGGQIRAHGIRWDITQFNKHTGGIFSQPKGQILKVNARFVDLPVSIPLAGNALNWLGFYILIAMPLTYIFRKMLGVA